MRSPRLYYGWVMVAALSLTEITSWGVLYYAFSVFLTPIGAEMGWSIAEMTGAYSLALLVSGVTAIPAGRWLDRHGPRGLMTAGFDRGDGARRCLVAGRVAARLLPRLGRDRAGDGGGTV
ncbi:MAG: hypothetical protein V9F06_02810 [Thermomicrobiales bacterium]